MASAGTTSANALASTGDGAADFDVERTLEPPFFQISQRGSGRRVRYHGLSYYMDLVQRALFHEEDVVAILGEVGQTCLNDDGMSPNTVVRVNVNQML